MKSMRCAEGAPGRWAWPAGGLALLVVLLLSRLVAGLIFAELSIVNDSGQAVRPWGPPAHLDFVVYQAHSVTAWDEMGRPLVFVRTWVVEGWGAALAGLHSLALKPGPVFPALIAVTGYAHDQVLLATVYLLAGAGLAWAWAQWVRMQGASWWLQAVLACFPALVYYSFLVSTDLLFAVVMAGFYACWRGALAGGRGYIGAAMGVLLLALCTRPVALSLIPLMFLAVQAQAWSASKRVLWMLLWTLTGLYMLVYYLPYFWVHETNGLGTHYWGLYPPQYRQGLWPNWPDWINLPMSWLLLGLSKLLHSVGLRPSYADLAPGLTMARALPGLLLLPGLLYGLWKSRREDRLFVLFFLPPVYVGAAQERYLLPVMPWLVYWGVVAWTSMYGRCRAYRLRHMDKAP